MSWLHGRARGRSVHYQRTCMYIQGVCAYLEVSGDDESALAAGHVVEELLLGGQHEEVTGQSLHLGDEASTPWSTTWKVPKSSHTVARRSPVYMLRLFGLVREALDRLGCGFGHSDSRVPIDDSFKLLDD